MLFSCFHRYICVEGVVRCHNNYIRSLHEALAHSSFAFGIPGYHSKPPQMSQKPKTLLQRLIACLWQWINFTMRLVQQSLHETANFFRQKLRTIKAASWNSVLAPCFFLFFFKLHTGNSTLDPETCRSIQPAAFLETTTSEVYFVRMWVAANTPILTGI